ncbi:MAG: hypothetical protein IJZ73_01350 [Clostridia bacterium]|nr:hypothetical protein [Clostridia bacterium]
MVKKRFLSGRTLLICITSLIFALSLSLGMLFACKPSEFNTNPDMEAIAGQTSTYLPVPTDGSTPADYSANDNVFIAFTVFANQDKVETFSVGSAVTKVGISVTQDIKSHRVVDGKEVYKESLSHSTFKGVGARLYVNGDNYIVHGANKVKSVDDVSWQSGASKISEENYTSLYGYIGNELTGYALTNDTILASRLIEEKDGLYTFEYILDTVDATGKLSLEMRTMAGTDSLPIFESASLIITMDSNWQVTSLKTNNVYKVDMLGGVTCVENVTETFTYGNEISIPNGEFFRSYLDSDVTEELPEEEVTALDFLMNGFGDYITGTKPLKVDLSLSASETLPLTVQGALELNINLEKLEDLSVTAKLDSITYDGVTLSDIIIKYAGGNVYVNKGAFNGVANVNDLMAKVTDLLDTLKVQMPDLEGTLGNIEVGSLLDNATLTEVDGGATINLPLSLAGIDINANLNFTNVEGVVSFTDATVSVAGVNLALSVNEQIDINMTADKYVDLLPLLDVINANGQIKIATEIAGLNVKAIVDLRDLSITAKTEIDGIEIIAKFIDGKIYAKALGVSVYFDTADIETVMNKLSAILGEDLGELAEIELPELDKVNVNDIINAITVNNKEKGYEIAINLGGISASVNLSTLNDELTIENITANVNGFELALTPAKFGSFDIGDISNSYNLVTLLDLISDDGEVKLNASIGDINIDAIVDIANMSVTAKTEIEGIEIKVQYADGKIYVNALDLNVYFDTADIDSVMEKLSVFLGDTVDNALGSVDLSGFENISGRDIAKSIKVSKGENTLTLALDIASIKASVTFNTTDGNLTLASINANVEGTDIAVTPSTIDAIDMGELDNYDNLATLLDVINENGEVQLQVVVGDITVDAILDLVNLTVTAKTEIEGIEIKVQYADGRIYVNALDLSVYLDTADIESVMEKLAPIIGDGLNETISSIDTSEVENFDAIAFIKSLVITNAGNNINIATTIMGIDASINLSNENDELAISSVVATVEGMNITVTPATVSAIDMGDLDNYNDIATLLNVLNNDGTISVSVAIGELNIDAIVDIKTLTISARTEIEGIEIIAQYKDGKISASALGLNVCIATSDIETVLNKLNPVIGDTIEESLGAIDTSAISEINVVDLIKSIIVTNGEDAIALDLEVSGIAIKVNLATTNNQLTLTNAIANVEGTQIIITPATVSAIDMGDADKYNDLTTLLDVINESGEIGLALSVGDINVDAIVDLNDLSITAKTEIEGINLTLKYIDGKIYVKVLGLNIYVATCDFENVMNKLSPIIGDSLENGLGSLDLTAFEEIDVVEIIKSIIVTENENDINLALSLAGINANVTLGTINNSLTFNGVSASVNDIVIEVNPVSVNAIDMGDLSVCHNVVPLLDLINSNNEIQLQAVIGDIKVDAIINLADMTITAKTEIEGIEIAIEYADGKIYASALGLKIFVNANEIESVMNKLSPIIGDSLDEGLGSIDLTAFENIGVVEIIKSIVITESEDAIDLAVELAGINVSAKLSTLNNELTFAGASATLDDMVIEVNPVSVDAIDMGNLTLYNNVVTLLDLINYNNEVQLQAQLNDIVIDATINLIDFTIKAQTNIDGSIVKILFENNTIYFDGFGIHAFVNVNDIQTILETIKPIIDKFVGADALGGLENLDLSATEEIDVVELIKSIVVTTDETANTVTLGVEISGIKLDVILSTVNNELNLDSVNAVIEGMNITVIDPVSPADIDFVIADNSFNLMTFVDTFGDAALDILIGDSITGTLSASATYNNSTYKLTADVQVDGINSAPRANANLVLEIATTQDDGTVKSSTHTIRLVYLDPSLVAEGAVNVYFTYNEGTNAEDKLEGTFTTTKADETLTTLKQIYQQIPQLQDLLYPFLTPDENGMPVMPEIQLEVATIINNVLFNDGVVSADINAKTLMDMLPESMGILLSAPENILTLSIPGADFNGNHIELNVAIGKPADGVITDDTFAYSVTNANDFSTINELLLTLKNTATWSSFNIEGGLDINAIGIVNMQNKANLYISIDMVGDDVYMVVRLRREFYSFGLGLLSLTAWKDYDGDSYLYLDPVAEKIYIYNEFRNADKKWYGFVPGSSGSESFSYTLDEFMADPMTPILKFARLSSTIEDLITKERETVASSATVENTLISYEYLPADSKFNLQLDLAPLTKDIQTVNADIGHDENMYVNSLNANIKVVSAIELTLGADIMQPYNQYQGTKEKVESMRATFA